MKSKCRVKPGVNVGVNVKTPRKSRVNTRVNLGYKYLKNGAKSTGGWADLPNFSRADNFFAIDRFSRNKVPLIQQSSLDRMKSSI